MENVREQQTLQEIAPTRNTGKEEKKAEEKKSKYHQLFLGYLITLVLLVLVTLLLASFVPGVN